MFNNYTQIQRLSTAEWRVSDRNEIKATYRAVLESMLDFIETAAFDKSFFTKFPMMRNGLNPDDSGNIIDRKVQNRVLAALLASFLHRMALDLQDNMFVLSCKLYEDVLAEMQRPDVGLCFDLLDSHYRVHRNNAYGKHGWQIVNFLLFGSSDNTSRHGLLDETAECNYVVGNTIIADGLLWQLTSGAPMPMSVEEKRDILIEFSSVFEKYFWMYPPKYMKGAENL